MNSSILLSYVTYVYGLAAFLYIFAWIFKRPLAGKMGTWVAALGLGGNIAAAGRRMREDVADELAAGVTVDLTATPHEGYHFLRWTGSAECAILSPGGSPGNHELGHG